LDNTHRHFYMRTDKDHDSYTIVYFFYYYLTYPSVEMIKYGIHIYQDPYWRYVLHFIIFIIIIYSLSLIIIVCTWRYAWHVGKNGWEPSIENYLLVREAIDRQVLSLKVITGLFQRREQTDCDSFFFLFYFLYQERL
jgi:hypothetical protein